VFIIGKDFFPNKTDIHKAAANLIFDIVMSYDTFWV